MKCPKWMWIIHPGSLELGFLERIFCQRFLKSCLVTKITSSHPSKKLQNSLILGCTLKIVLLRRPSLEHLWCESRDEAAHDISVRLKSRRWQMLAGITTCQQKNIPWQGSYERAAYQDGQTALTSCGASAPDPWRRTCVCCLKRLRQLLWWCCRSQMAWSHRMRGWVSNIGNWRWDMIE